LTAEQARGTIRELRLESRLDLADVEHALQAAAQAAATRGLGTSQAELARVDLLPDRTVVYFRGDETVASGLEEVLAKKAPKAKLSMGTVAPEVLTKEP